MWSKYLEVTRPDDGLESTENYHLIELCCSAVCYCTYFILHGAESFLRS